MGLVHCSLLSTWTCSLLVLGAQRRASIFSCEQQWSQETHHTEHVGTYKRPGERFRSGLLFERLTHSSSVLYAFHVHRRIPTFLCVPRKHKEHVHVLRREHLEAFPIQQWRWSLEVSKEQSEWKRCLDSTQHPKHPVWSSMCLGGSVPQSNGISNACMLDAKVTIRSYFVQIRWN